MRILILVLACLFSSLASAQSYTNICVGEVERIAYHQPDGLYLKVGNSGIMKICSPEGQYYRTGPESCKLIATLATTARATGKQLEIYIDESPFASCESIPDWSGANVRFVELYK